MVRSRLQQTILAVAICLVAMGPAPLRADDVPAERRLPPGVLALFSIPDAVDLKDRFLESSFGQLIKDDSLDEFRDQFDEHWEKASREIEEELGLSVDELLKIIDGEVTVAVLQPLGGDLGLVAMIGFGSERAALDTLLEKAEEGIEGAGADRTVETIQDTDVTIFTKGGGDGPDTMAYFIRDQHFVYSLGVGTDVIEDVLARWDGEHDETLADDEVYSYIMQQCQPDGADRSQVRWYFNPIDLFRSVVAMMPQANQGPVSPALALAVLQPLGLDKFRAVGGASAIGTDEFDGVSHTFLYVDQPTNGLVRFFECPPARQQPPMWVPAGVSFYSSANWDIDGAYDALKSIVDFFQPAGTLENVVEQLASQGPQVHLKDDVIDSLTGRLQLLGESPEDLTAEQSQPGVFALEVRDADTMADVLQRVADISDGDPGCS